MKNARQKKILELISKYAIDTQETLIGKLREEGYKVTQTTVSRDINQLKLVKGITPDGTYKYVSSQPTGENGVPVLSSILTESVVSVVGAQNLIVIRTFSGMANALAVCVDSMGIKEILGSVAGDDTILLILPDSRAAAEVAEKLKVAFGIQA